MPTSPRTPWFAHASTCCAMSPRPASFPPCTPRPLPRPHPRNRPPPREPIVLTPFAVNADNDKGYLAGSSLAGSRTATSLKGHRHARHGVHAAVPRRRRRDRHHGARALHGQHRIRRWRHRGPQNFASSTMRRRCACARPAARPRSISSPSTCGFDTFSLDRVDQSRGPNSILRHRRGRRAHERHDEGGAARARRRSSS